MPLSTIFQLYRGGGLLRRCKLVWLFITNWY